MYISVICVSARALECTGQLLLCYVYQPERWSVPNNYCCVMGSSRSAGVYLTIAVVLRMCISRSAGVYLTITVVLRVAAGAPECM